MSIHFNLIIQNNKFHFIPILHFHVPAFDDDFYVFSVSWLFFNFLVTTHELLSGATSWREVVKVLVDDDEDTMERLDALVRNYDEYTEEEFAHKAKYIANGLLKDDGME